jgi:hypothetical protein
VPRRVLSGRTWLWRCERVKSGVSERGGYVHDDDAAKIDQEKQSAESGAAQDEQGLGQHADKDVTDVETKQDHAATPSDVGNR